MFKWKILKSWATGEAWQRVLLFSLIIWLLAGCSSVSDCCSRHNPEVEEAMYCSQHAEVVRKYVRASQDRATQVKRLAEFKRFFKKIDDCNNMSCLSTVMYGDDRIVEISQYYTVEHEVLERSTRLPGKDKLKLIKCGFRTAIYEFESKFKLPVTITAPDSIVDGQ